MTPAKESNSNGILIAGGLPRNPSLPYLFPVHNKHICCQDPISPIR